MTMHKLYAYDSVIGTFYICRRAETYFALLGNKLLGTYPSAEDAARLLATRNHVTLPANLVRKALGIPAALDEWEDIG